MTDSLSRTNTPLTGWTFREWSEGTPLEETLRDPSGWRPATVPGTVQQELLALGELPDPFYSLNEHDVQWVSDRHWLYRAEFQVPPGAQYADLCLDGLDTLCTVSLNGEVVLESENMFVPQRVDLRGRLREGANELLLHFHPVLPHIHRLRDEHGLLTAWNGDPSRVYLRKAQYHFGWDWGPTLLAVGPWQPVRLETYHARIAELAAPATVTGTAEAPQVSLHPQVTVLGNVTGRTLHARLRDPEGVAVWEVSGPLSAEGCPAVERPHDVSGARLWWPRGHGEQPLYTLEVTLRQGDTVLDTHTKRLGFRQVELVQEPVAGEEGTSFTFRVNGRELFMGGTNWIPEDLLLPRIPAERYRERIWQAVEGNQLMLRVWGGGIYENDLFYDLCDEAGLLVWQDFMFACGLYPAYPAFLDNVRAEAEAAVRRLRHHPCLALWCGGNENYAVAQAAKAEAEFVGPAIHAGVLPDVVARLDPLTPYWTDSPFGGERAGDKTVGDRHTWDVYHGMVAVEDYRLCEGRFVSEFGMQSLPSLAAIETVTPPDERRPHSRVMEHHQKAKGGTRRLASYLSDLFDPAGSLEQFVYDSQLLQAEAMKYAYQAFRGRWGKPGARAVSGALAWQLNDLWPVSSWAVIDSLGVPKPAFYAIARELRPVVVGLDRRLDEWGAWLVSDRPEPQATDLHWEVFDFAGKLLAEWRWSAVAAPNAVTPLALPESAPPADGIHFLRAFAGGEEVSRCAYWPRPFRYYRLPDDPPACRWDGQTLTVQAPRPLKNVWVVAGAARASDNALDLRPGERVTLTFDRLLSDPPRVQALGVPAFTALQEFK
ncbi:beta-mannosidase [Deinococcus wulumuqiensis]|uniref:beta-mannosidase n=1 Tax=Deinococcus wulumuqiensis TaxID=980427 RepID=UPI00242B8BBE|nr:glycoside hydrolase family 2 protein [Deinococcus wulumuqiensis]